MSRLKITSRALERPELETCWREGLTYGQIAAKLGVSRSLVAGYLARRGLKRGTARGGWEERKRALAAGKKFDQETRAGATPQARKEVS